MCKRCLRLLLALQLPQRKLNCLRAVWWFRQGEAVVEVGVDLLD